MDVGTATVAAAASVKKVFLILNCILLAVGICGGPLIARLYFIHGGERIWFSSWLQTGGCPLMLIPLLVSYTRRRRSTAPAAAELFLMKPRLLLASAFIGVLIGADNYLYAFGIAKLPVSTSTLLLATQLGFTAAFAFLIVKQKFTAYSVNAVVLLTVAVGLLGLHAGGDRPEGETDKEYWLGFSTTVGAAALYGLIMPLVELTYKQAKQEITYNLVMEMQLVMGFFSTVFCTLGMLINNDFQAISREAKAYEIGETKYYTVVVGSAIIWQCGFLGSIGVIFYSTSLFFGIMVALLLPITEILAILFYQENFQAEKGISLFLSLWGFVFYFWGEKKAIKKRDDREEEDRDDREEEDDHHHRNAEMQTANSQTPFLS